MNKSLKLIFAASLLLGSGLALAKGMSVDDPYVREVPPGQMISASFMTIKNDNDKEIALIKASSDVAKKVELHEHVHEGGMMKMRPVAKIVIPAKGATPLKPGGYHIMLIGLQRKIKAGDKIDLTLEFDNGDKETVTATVKKVMMGMQKGMKMGDMKGMHKMKGMHGMKAMKQDTSHLNPMPNLMQVIKKMPEKLNLSKEQMAALKKGMEERAPRIKALFENLKKHEKEIFEAALADKSINDIEVIADKIQQDRLAIMKGKANCREAVKEILDEKQFKTLVELYRANMMPKKMPMDEMQTKMAMIKHANPMPNLMMVIKKMSDKLNLTEEQAAKLKAWRDERGPVMKKQYKAVMDFEKQIKEASLNNEPVEKLDQLANAITMERMKIIRGKSFCRDKMKMTLNPDQYEKVIELFRANFMTGR